MTPATRLSAALVALAAAAAPADDKKPDGKTFDDAEFVKMAASGGMHEVEAGKLAVAQARNDAVKKFGQMMVDDHTKANEELKKAAKAIGLPVPDKMLAKDQKAVDALKDAKAEGFDRAYVADQLKSHEESAALLALAAKESKYPEFKAFASKTLPTVKEHLEKLKKLQDQVK